MKLKLEKGLRPDLGQNFRIVNENGEELPGVIGVNVTAPSNTQPTITVEFLAGEDFDISSYLESQE